MLHTPSYFPAVSLHLSRVLDEAGLSVTTVTRRQETHLKSEKVLTLCSKFSDDNISVFSFGSQIEGSTTPGLASDADTLYCLNDIKVIQTPDEWTEGRTNVLMVQKQGMSDAYCHLQLLQNDSPLPMRELPNVSDYSYDVDGNVILKNSILHRDVISDAEIHGPAHTHSGRAGQIDNDYVFAYRCDSWPLQGHPWLERVKRKLWPPNDIVKFSEENGTFLVPVGHRLSLNRDLEWRISPSLAERRFMLSMNMTQMKCYVLLKMIKRELITPYAGEYLTSFQLKCILFFCMENTRPDLWREENLLKCLSHCLFVLLFCVINRFCPNYIFTGENLFAGRNSAWNKDLDKYIIYLLKTDGRFLLSLDCDDLGIKLQNSFKRDRLNYRFSVEEDNTKSIINCCEHTYIRTFLLWFRVLLFGRVYMDTCSFILDLLNITEELRSYRNHVDDEMRAVYIDVFPFVCSFIGSAFVSYLVKSGASMSPAGLMWLNRGKRSDLLSGRLKLASALFSTGNFVQASRVLAEAEALYDPSYIQPICACHDETCFRFKSDFYDRIPFCTNGYEKRQLMACCVMYTLQEFYCCPPALRFEWCRNFEEEMHTIGPEDDWMHFAVVDSVACLYYLQYIVYGKTDEVSLQRRALNNLETCIEQESSVLSHPETAMNLLGKCMEMERRFIDARNCYYTSLQKRPTHNAANFHIRNLRSIMNGYQLLFEFGTEFG